MSDFIEPELPEDADRRSGQERRMHSVDWVSDRERLIRMDERLKMMSEDIKSLGPALDKMRDDIRHLDQRSLANEHTVDRHDSLLNWLLRIVLGSVLVAVLVAAGISTGSF